MTLSTSTPAAALALLRAEHSGPVFVPGDEGYDAARQAWNLRADQRPAVVAIAAGTADVQAAVAFAARHGLRVAPQGTGHNATALGPLEGAMLLRTGELRGVAIDAERRVARVEAGALWADVTGPAAELGLAPLAGSAPDVGVVGYTLGGGLSWLGRRHGLAANHLLAAEVVLGDGSLVRADVTTHADLLWALRGGGGSFGVVTAVELRLFAQPSVYAGMLLWPSERAEEVLNAWAAWTETVSEEITTSARIVQVPPFPDVPELLRGRAFVAIDGAHCGAEADAVAALAPLRALGPEIDTFADVSPAALSHIHMDPEAPVPGVSAHALLDAAGPETVAAIVAAAGPGSASPLVAVELRHLGGALGRPGDEPAATPSLPATYGFFAVGIAAGPEATAAAEATLAELREAVAPADTGRRFLSFEEEAGADRSSLWDAATRARLREVRAAYDPAGVLQANHPV